MFCGAPNVQGLQRARMGFWMDARLGAYLWLLEGEGVAVVAVVVASVVVQKQPRLGPWRLIPQERPGRLPRKCLWQTMWRRQLLCPANLLIRQVARRRRAAQSVCVVWQRIRKSLLRQVRRVSLMVLRRKELTVLLESSLGATALRSTPGWVTLPALMIQITKISRGAMMKGSPWPWITTQVLLVMASRVLMKLCLVGGSSPAGGDVSQSMFGNGSRLRRSMGVSAWPGFGV
jgi:hypothetical protein